MPGTDPAEAMRVIAGELPDFPHLPELPARGPGADLTGRTAGLLVDIPVEVSPRGWRLAERPGRDLNRARSMLSSDLDVLEEVLDGYRGLVKVQLCGPWTLAATLELPRTLNVAIADPGAVADLTASLAEGAAAHVAELAKRVPGARIAVQFDEPALPAVAGGEVPTASGLVAPPPGRGGGAQGPAGAGDRGRPGLHGGAQLRGGSPVRPDPDGGGRCALLRPQPATARRRGRDRRGRRGRPGAADRRGSRRSRNRTPGPASPAARTPVRGPAGPGDGSAEARQTAERVIRLWHRLGLPLATCPDQAVITPACGLAGASPAQARAALTRCREAASMLAELIEETGES